MPNLQSLGIAAALALTAYASLGQHDAPAISRDPSQVIDQALTRILDGRESTPTGDRRGLKMTPQESAAADEAGRIFNTVEFRAGFGYPVATIYDMRFPEQADVFKRRLRQSVEMYGSKDPLSHEELSEVVQALTPFLHRLAIESEVRSGQFRIPPNTKCRYHFASVCMDKDWPAPRAGEKLRLVPVEDLLPGRLSEVYRSIARRAAQSDAYQADLQGLAWTLRQIAGDIEGKKPVTISERQRRLLNESMTNGYAVFEAVRRPLGRSALPKEFEDMVRNEVKAALGGPDSSSSLVTRTIPDDQLVQAVDEQMERLRQMPVDAPVPNNNSHYTRIAPRVFARCTFGSLDIQIANASEEVFTFDPTSVVGQSEREVQRMAPVPVTGEDLAVSVLDDIGQAAEVILDQTTVVNDGFVSLYPLLLRDAAREVDNHEANALDIFAEGGTPVFPIAGGTVVKINAEGIAVGAGTSLSLSDDPGRGLGKYVIVKHVLPDGSVVWSCYGHLSEINSAKVREGQDIAVSTRLGSVGDTGTYLGTNRRPHLHVQIDTVEPWQNQNIASENKAFPVPPYYENHPISGRPTKEITKPVLNLLERYGSQQRDNEGVIGYDRARYLQFVAATNS